MATKPVNRSTSQPEPARYDAVVFVGHRELLVVDGWEHLPFRPFSVEARFLNLTLRQVRELAATLDPHHDNVQIVRRTRRGIRVVHVGPAFTDLLTFKG